MLAVGVPVGLGLFTLRSSGTAATVLRPISPVSTNPPALMDAADYIRTQIVDRGATLAIDSDATYLDLQVGFAYRLTAPMSKSSDKPKKQQKKKPQKTLKERRSEKRAAKKVGSGSFLPADK